MQNKKINPYLLLFFAVLAVSTAAIIIRFALMDASPIVVATYRLALSALIAWIMVFIRRKDLHFTRSWKNYLLIFLAGLFLAVHFGSWITSLGKTSVSSSVVLATTTPLWVSLLTPIFLKEKITKRFGFGLAIAFIGVIIISLNEQCALGQGGLVCKQGFSFIGKGNEGLFLAMFGAWMMAAYLIIGRKLSSQMDTVSYTSGVYTVAALLLVGYSLLKGEQLFGYAPMTYGLFIALAVVPQTLGHSILNHSMKFLSAAIVSIAILGEPIGSTVLAMILLNEYPTTLQVIGGLFILGGIALALFSPKPANVA